MFWCPAPLDLAGIRWWPVTWGSKECHIHRYCVNWKFQRPTEEKDLFDKAAPNLFRSNFAKCSKDFMDQMKAMCLAAPPRSYQTERGSYNQHQKWPFYLRNRDFNRTRKDQGSFRYRDRPKAVTDQKYWIFLVCVTSTLTWHIGI